MKNGVKYIFTPFLIHIKFQFKLIHIIELSIILLFLYHNNICVIINQEKQNQEKKNQEKQKKTQL